MPAAKSSCGPPVFTSSAIRPGFRSRTVQWTIAIRSRWASGCMRNWAVSYSRLDLRPRGARPKPFFAPRLILEQHRQARWNRYARRQDWKTEWSPCAIGRPGRLAGSIPVCPTPRIFVDAGQVAGPFRCHGLQSNHGPQPAMTGWARRNPLIKIGCPKRGRNLLAGRLGRGIG